MMLVDAVSLWYISTLLPNRENKQTASQEVHSLIRILHICLACLRRTCKTSVVIPRNITDDSASLVFEAIETIIPKPPTVPVVRIVPKFFYSTRAIRTIRTMIWKRGLKNQISSLTLFRPGYFCFLRSIWTQVVFEVILRHYDVILLNLLSLYWQYTNSIIFFPLEEGLDKK